MNKIINLDTPATAEKWEGNTRAAFIQARRDGLALAKRMGNGWNAEVWENLGWHYMVRSPCGRIQLHASKYDGKIHGYNAYLHKAGETGGIWSESGDTPQVAVKRTVNTAKKQIKFYQSLVEGL